MALYISVSVIAACIAAVLIIVVIVCIVIWRALSVSSSLCAQRWQRSPRFGSLWYQHVRMKKAFDELVPVVFVACLVYPISQGPKTIDVDCVDVSKQ